MRKIAEETPRTESKVDLHEYGRILWRRKIMLVVPIVMSLGVTVLGLRFLEPLYRASTVIRVDDRELLNADVVRLMQAQGARVSLEQDQKALAKLEAVVKGTEFQQLLIERLGLANDSNLIAEAQEAVVKDNLPLSVDEYVYLELRSRLAKKTEVKYEGPSMFRIGFVDQSAEVAFVVADAMANLFIELEERKEMEGLKDLGEFSDEQLAVYKNRLERSEHELEQFRRTATEKDLQTNPVGPVNIKVAETLSQNVAININDKRDMIDNMQANLDRLLPVEPDFDRIVRNQRVLDLQKSLIAKREAQLLLQLKGDGGSVDRNLVEQGLADVQGSLQRYLATFIRDSQPDVDPDYLPLLVECSFQMVALKGFEAKKKSVDQYIRTYKEKLAQGPQFERRLRELQEEVDGNRDLYQSFLRAKATTQISEAAQNTSIGLNIEIVEPASRPLLPHSPKKPKILIIALLFGGFIGLSGLVLSEYSDSSYRNVDEIEKDIGIRVLGTVPQLVPGKTWKRDGGSRKLVTWATLWGLILLLAVGAFYFYGKFSARQAIQFSRAQTSEQR